MSVTPPLASTQLALGLTLAFTAACASNQKIQLQKDLSRTEEVSVVIKQVSPKPAISNQVDLQLQNTKTAKEAFALALRRDRAQQWQSAANAYRKAISLDEKLLRARINLGLVAIQLGEYQRAKQECSSVLAANELISMAHYCIAETLAAQQKLSEAIPAYVRALAFRKKAPIVRLAFARTLRKKGNLDNAVLQLTQTASEAADLPNLLLHVAQEFIEIKKLDDALGVYSELCSRHPSHYLAHLKFGRLLMKTSLSAQAGLYLEKANKLDPNNIKPVLALLNWSLQENLQDKAQDYLALSKTCTINKSKTHLKLAHYYWFFGYSKLAKEHIRQGLTKPASVNVTRSLEKMLNQIDSKERPKKVNPFYSSKARIPVKTLPKPRTPAK